MFALTTTLSAEHRCCSTRQRRFTAKNRPARANGPIGTPDIGIPAPSPTRFSAVGVAPPSTHGGNPMVYAKTVK